MDKENKLGLDSDDINNIKAIMDDLVDVVAKFNGFSEITAEDFHDLKGTLDVAQFVVSGVIYQYGLGFEDCEHDEDGVE